MTEEDLKFETDIRLRVEALFGSIAEEVEWFCDSREAISGTVISYNEYLRANNRREEEEFSLVSGKPCKISELLMRDYQYFCASPSLEILRKISSQMRYFEIDRPDPNAGIAIITTMDPPIFAVVFNSQMMSLLNSAFSKIYIITHDEITAGCEPKFEECMQGESYSDTKLLLEIFREIEDVFVNGEPYALIDPPHVAFPYDYCERVDGARRFILGHEISHIFYDPERSDIAVDLDQFEWLDNDRKQAWKREFWCDALSVQFLMDWHKNNQLIGTRLHELGNALIGVLTYFTFMEIVECSLLGRNMIPKTHPRAYHRREYIRKIIKSHPIFIENPPLQNVLSQNWKRLNSFREFAGGSNCPMSFQGNWNIVEFIGSLSPFGRQAYRALFDSVVSESIYYNWDMEKILMNKRIF